MMVVLYNPHVDDFLAEPPHYRLLKRRPLRKYGFFIDESLRKGQAVNVLVDGTSSAFISERVFHKLPQFLRWYVSEVEYKIWLRINRFGTLVRRVQAPKEKSDEVLLAFSYKSATGDFALRRNVLTQYRAVVFHLSHYFVLTKEKSENIKTLDNAWLAGDSDIRDIDYFKHFFSWYKKEFLVLPFAVSPRFCLKKKYSERQNRCVATGSFHDLTQEQPPEKYVDYLCATQSTTYHPIRKEIYDQAASVKSLVESKISPYRKYGQSSKLKRLIGHFLVAQKKYFSIDIVDLYNDYRFAVVGEELSGFPALGAFEAMACGCTLIADKKYYKGLGLAQNEHYINYEGTLNSLLMTITTQQTNGSDQIVTAGANFITSRFSPVAVFQEWNSVISRVQPDKPDA
jgi:hypothetical protein